MKKCMSIFLALAMLLISVSVPVLAADTKTLFLSPEDFKENMGSWTYMRDEKSKPFQSLLIGREDKAKDLLKPAGINISVPADGTYTIYARTRDFAANQGTRLFQIAVNGVCLPQKLGAHGTDGWAWEVVGKVELKKGVASVEIVDITGYTPRVEGIVLSAEQEISLPETETAFQSFKSQHACEVVGGELVESVSRKQEAEAVNTVFLEEKNYTALDYTSFSTLGTWEVKQDSGTLLPSFLYSNKKSGGEADNAKAFFAVAEDGIYDVWVHTKDAATNPGTRSFHLAVDNGEKLVAGGHGQDGWHWDKIAVCPLFAGEHTITLSDYRGNFSRTDMIVITNDKDFRLGEDKAVIQKLQAEYLYKPGSVSAGGRIEADNARPQEEIAVLFNGSYMQFDVPPVLINDRTMVPMRAIFEALGCFVSWNDAAQAAIGTRNGTTVILTIGADTAKVDGVQVPLDAPAALINDRTMIPLRFVSEALGAQVDWQEETKTVRILANIPKAACFLRPESFEMVGTWFVETGRKDAFNGTTLRGLVKPEDNPAQTPEDYANPSSAVAVIPIVKSGKYQIWVHAMDFETNSPGSRFFQIGVNDMQVEQKFGTHGKDGYQWESAGVFELEKGENRISLYDASKFYARCDGILITEDLQLIPPESYAAVCGLAKPYNPADSRVTDFPAWAKSENAPVDSVQIENGKTKLVFYKVPTENGVVVQSEIYAKSGDAYILTKKRNEPLGYLFMQAAQSLKAGNNAEIAAFKNTYMLNGAEKSYLGENVYHAGNPLWLIPSDYVISHNQVTLLFPDNESVDFRAVWELDDDRSPKVSLHAVFKQKGAYSIGSFEGGGFSEYDFAMIPYRIMSRQVQKDRGLTTQQSALTPMVTYTLAENNQYAAQKVTKGVVVEPSWIPVQWNYTENNRFGLAAIDPSGAYGAGVFAPLFGTEDCRFEAGETYDFQYRVISEVSDWFDSYKHIAKDLFQVTDYRSNYYTSLNEAIYNTLDLMLEDDLSGWNEQAKAFYNMESSYMASNANPMALLQAYQLTENKELLQKRTIPNLANLLTRPALHMNWTLNTPTFNWGGHEIGSPIQYYNLNVMGGIYEQTGGTLPWLLNYAVEKAKSGTVNETASAVAPFMNDLHLYKYTGDASYLEKAVAAADNYLEKVVYAPKTSQPSTTAFVYSGYYPSLSSLLDIYEVTKEQRYLDAAKYTGQWISAMVQTVGVDDSKKNQTILVNEPEKVAVRWQGGEGTRLSSTFWWHGDVIWRQGTSPGNPADTEAAYAHMRQYVEEVPLWLASPVGLGVEQPVTFVGSSYITMQCWAGDMVRLAKLTGEDYFESVARNAMIGRFGGYSGYYLQRFWTYYMQPDYAFYGPDFTNIYWHHIPEFYSMLCDFLVNEISAKTDGAVSFPGLRQQGYAYFDSNQYGYAPGKFYDEADMWLWLDRGILEPDSVQIDYLAARKDGVFAAAFLNESNEQVTTIVRLGEKIPGGAAYSGSATLFSDGTATEIAVENGAFSLTLAPKAAAGVRIAVPELTAPSFSKLSYTLNGQYAEEDSVCEHQNGKAFALQMSPDEYFAYVYVTDTEQTVSEMKVFYTMDGEERSESVSTYPFEIIIPVLDVQKAFTYRIELTKTDGSTERLTGGTVLPIGK